MEEACNFGGFETIRESGEWQYRRPRSNKVVRQPTSEKY
jgi:hypothetical protein